MPNKAEAVARLARARRTGERLSEHVKVRVGPTQRGYVGLMEEKIAGEDPTGRFWRQSEGERHSPTSSFLPFSSFVQVEEESLFDQVTEEEYQKVVRRRQLEGIVDGDGELLNYHTRNRCAGLRGGVGEEGERG